MREGEDDGREKMMGGRQDDMHVHVMLQGGGGRVCARAHARSLTRACDAPQGGGGRACMCVCVCVFARTRACL